MFALLAGFAGNSAPLTCPTSANHTSLSAQHLPGQGEQNDLQPILDGATRKKKPAPILIQITLSQSFPPLYGNRSCYCPPIWSHFGIAVMEPTQSGSPQWRKSVIGSMEPLRRPCCPGQTARCLHPGDGGCMVMFHLMHNVIIMKEALHANHHHH